MSFLQSCVRVLAPLAAAGTLALPTHAQESLGRLFNLEASPSNPNLLAFERLEARQRLIHFQNLATGEVFPLAAPQGARRGGLLGIAGSAREGADVEQFSGDLAWMPTLDTEGRQWFAYVTGGGGLYLNYFDENGALSADEPRAVDYQGTIRTPAWSHDGARLAFVADSRIHLLEDSRPALRGASEPQSIRVLGAEDRQALYPTWSPDGDRIAYALQTPVAGAPNWAIAVIELDEDGEEAYPPIVVTATETDSDELKPSWSRDGALVAYYVDRGASATQQDIGIVRLQEGGDGRLFRGQVLRGRSRRIAEDVFPNEIRGPAWSFCDDEAPAIVYVLQDESRDYPVISACLQEWEARRPSAEYEIDMSALYGWGTAQNKFVTALLSRGSLDFVYVSQVPNGETLQFQHTEAEWQVLDRLYAPAPRLDVGERDIADPERDADPEPNPDSDDDLIRGPPSRAAMVLPGLYQWQSGSRFKGAAIGAAFVGAGVFLATSFSDLSTREDAVVAVAEASDGQIRSTDPAYESWTSARDKVHIAAGAIGAVLVVNLVDGLIGGPTSDAFGLQVDPTRSPRRFGLRGGGFDLTFWIRR